MLFFCRDHFILHQAGASAFAELNNTLIDMETIGPDPALQHHSFKVRTTAQGYIDLPAVKRIASIDNRFFKSKSLAFVNSDGPGQPQWVLGKRSQNFLFHSTCAFI